MNSSEAINVFKEMKTLSEKLTSLLYELEPDETMSDVDDVENSDEGEFLRDKVRSYEILLIPNDREIERSVGVSPLKEFNGKWIQGIYFLDTAYEYPQWTLDEIYIYNN